MSDSLQMRLAFLLETAELECRHLAATDARLFAVPFTSERAATLSTDEALAERLDAFVARFARVQDTAGDKLLPFQKFAPLALFQVPTPPRPPPVRTLFTPVASLSQ
jgi:hypothetical protein